MQAVIWSSGRPVIRCAVWLIPALLLAASTAEAADKRLVDAVRAADRAAVRDLVQKGADVNAVEADGMTPLHWAVLGGDLETATLLIRAGADAKAATRYGVRPLALAASNGSATMIVALAEAGADVNAASPEGETPLMLAARVGRVEAIDALLGRGAAVNARETWKGQSALMWAAGEGYGPAIARLVKAGADLSARSKGGFTPLLFAVRNGHLEAVRLLLTLGADSNDRVTVSGPAADRYGRRPAAPDAPTSALGMAAINGYYELGLLLLEGGADPNVADPRGSLLHAVAFMRRPGSGNPPQPSGRVDTLDLARALLARGADPNRRITWREIPFDRDLAATRLPPNIPIGRNFLSFIGATPFYVAAKHGDVALMRLLVAHGADPKMTTVQGVTPLMAAAGLGFWDGESPGPLTGVPETESVEAVRMTLELGNDVNAIAEFGGPFLEGDGGTLLRRHPLNFLSYDGAHEAPLEVVPPRESLGDMRWSGSTALHGAAMRGSNAIVQFLIDHGGDLTARNKLGWTPLMCAEGVFVSNTLKDWPETEALIRKLMRDRGMTPELFDQASIGVTSVTKSAARE